MKRRCSAEYVSIASPAAETNVAPHAARSPHNRPILHPAARLAILFAVRHHADRRKHDEDRKHAAPRSVPLTERIYRAVPGRTAAGALVFRPSVTSRKTRGTHRPRRAVPLHGG